ncbi:MAG: hypothetical protein AB7T27_04280 [Kiritimatiellia bacterium]
MQRTTLLMLILSLAAFGCAKKEEPAALSPAPAEPPAEVPFTSTEEVVAREDIQMAEEQNKTVTADFDMDGLEDLAVVDPRDGHQNEVNIYIQKPEEKQAQPAPSTAPAAPAGGAASLTSPEKGKIQYYKAGVIRQPKDGTVIGLMIRKRKDITDLLVLLQDQTLNNQMLHYLNDGQKFFLDE